MLTKRTTMSLPTTKIFAFLLLLVLSAPPLAETATIFKTTVPTACVTDYLGPAGFCALQMGCHERCFGDAPTLSSRELDPTRNFYIPVNATECDQLEEPICPTTSCCPACKEELDDLFRCMINEGGHHYLYYLAGSCPLDCSAPPAPPTPFPTPSPTQGPTPNPTPEPIQNTPAIRSRSPTIEPSLDPTDPLQPVNETNVGVDPIVVVDFDTNSTLPNCTEYNITNCTAQDIGVICTTYVVNGTVVNGTVVNCTMVNGTMVTGIEVNATEVNTTLENSTSNINGPMDNSMSNSNDPVDSGMSNSNDTVGNEIVNNNDPVDNSMVVNNDPGDSGTNSNNPLNGEDVPMRDPITIVSTNDSVTMIDSHHNTTMTMDNSPAGITAEGTVSTTTTTVTNDEPQDDEDEVSEPASVTVDPAKEVQIIEADEGKNVVLVVSNADFVTIMDTYHNTTTVVSTKSP